MQIPQNTLREQYLGTVSLLIEYDPAGFARDLSFDADQLNFFLSDRARSAAIIKALVQEEKEKEKELEKERGKKVKEEKKKTGPAPEPRKKNCPYRKLRFHKKNPLRRNRLPGLSRPSSTGSDAENTGGGPRRSQFFPLRFRTDSKPR